MQGDALLLVLTSADDRHESHDSDLKTAKYSESGKDQSRPMTANFN